MRSHRRNCPGFGNKTVPRKDSLHSLQILMSRVLYSASEASFRWHSTNWNVIVSTWSLWFASKYSRGKSPRTCASSKAHCDKTLLWRKANQGAFTPGDVPCAPGWLNRHVGETLYQPFQQTTQVVHTVCGPRQSYISRIICSIVQLRIRRWQVW